MIFDDNWSIVIEYLTRRRDINVSIADGLWTPTDANVENDDPNKV